MAKEKKDKKALKNAKKDIWNNYSTSEKKALEKLCLNYRHFLSKCKTERECVKEIIFQAQRAGYRDLKISSLIKKHFKLVIKFIPYV